MFAVFWFSAAWFFWIFWVILGAKMDGGG